jgi:hypothetical protein
MKAHGMGCLHLLLDALNQFINVGRRCSTGVDDEVGVKGGDFGTADATALQPETFDQPTCFQGSGLRNTLPQLGCV